MIKERARNKAFSKIKTKKLEIKKLKQSKKGQGTPSTNKSKQNIPCVKKQDKVQKTTGHLI